ncbi:hypothetical protein ABBQ32_008399 [Trebouxia sp. C0010 RCD-2024]
MPSYLALKQHGMAVSFQETALTASHGLIVLRVWQSSQPTTLAAWRSSRVSTQRFVFHSLVLPAAWLCASGLSTGAVDKLLIGSSWQT